MIIGIIINGNESMELTKNNLELIRSSPALREAILKALGRHGVGPEALKKPLSKLDKDFLDCLHDAAFDALMDCGIVVESRHL